MAFEKHVVNYRAGEQLVQPIPLHLITVSHNPRNPCETLQEKGFDMMALVHEYALSDALDSRKYFVELIEGEEPAIVEQAESMKQYGQIQPITLRAFSSKDEGVNVTRYGIACGERRFIAKCYLFAKYGGGGRNNTIQAHVRKITVKDAYWLGVQENLQRKQMKEWEIGNIFYEWAKENGKGNRIASVTKIAEHFNVEYAYARGRLALAQKLPDERLELLKKGEITLTNAIKEALGEVDSEETPAAQKGPNGKRKRDNPMTKKEMLELFDKTPRSNVDGLQMLATVLKVPYEEALEASDKRIQAQEIAEANAAVRSS